MIKISKRNVEFILSNIYLPKHFSVLLNSASIKGILLSYDDADELRDLCTAFLDEYGFDENYVLTDKGEKAENLIEQLYIG